MAVDDFLPTLVGGFLDIVRRAFVTLFFETFTAMFTGFVVGAILIGDGLGSRMWYGEWFHFTKKLWRGQ